MEQTELQTSLRKTINGIVVVHALVVLVQGYSRTVLDYRYVLSSSIPIVLGFAVVPLIAAAILSTKFVRQGAIILLGVLWAEICLTIASRFNGPMIYMGKEPSFLWRILFEGAFGLALILEAAGSWYVIRLMRELHKKPSTTLPATPEHGTAKD